MIRQARVFALLCSLGLGCVFTSRPQLPDNERSADGSVTGATNYDAAAPSDVFPGFVDDSHDGAARSDASQAPCQNAATDAGDAGDVTDASDADDASDASDAGDATDAGDASDASRHAGCDAGAEVGPGAAGH